MAVHFVPEQLWLPRFEAASKPTDRLFFAIFPDDATARRIAQLARHLQSEYRLQGEPLQSRRFHVSLCHLGNYFHFPEDVVARITEAASRIALPPFEVAVDRVISFSGRHIDTEKGSYPIVLLARDGIAELIRLRQSLGAAKVKAGLEWKGRTQFTPHVTLLYDQRDDIAQTVEPIRWTVREFVLVHSLLGQTRHVALGRWPLSRRYPAGSVKPPAKTTIPFVS